MSTHNFAGNEWLHDIEKKITLVLTETVSNIGFKKHYDLNFYVALGRLSNNLQRINATFRAVSHVVLTTYYNKIRIPCNKPPQVKKITIKPETTFHAKDFKHINTWIKNFDPSYSLLRTLRKMKFGRVKFKEFSK